MKKMGSHRQKAKIIILFVAGVLIFTSLCAEETKIVKKEETRIEEQKPEAKENKRAWQLLNDLRQLTERLQQIEKEKMEMLEKLERQKQRLTGTKFFSDRLHKAEIEKIILQLHSKIDEGKKLEEEQKELLLAIVADGEVKNLVQQRINNISQRIEKLAAEPDKNRMEIELLKKERINWKRAEDVITATEEFGVAEALAIINLPAERILPPPEPFFGEKMPPPEEWTTKGRRAFFLGRLQRRLNRMEEEIRFLRQQIERLQNGLNEIRKSLPAEELPPEPFPPLEEKLGLRPPHQERPDFPAPNVLEPENNF